MDAAPYVDGRGTLSGRFHALERGSQRGLGVKIVVLE